MKYKQYKKIISETAVFPKTVDNFDLAYFYLGLIDELYELNNAFQISTSTLAIAKEISDCIWYLTGLATLYDIELEMKITQKTEFEKLAVQLMGLAGNIKKYYRDNKQIDKSEIELVIILVENYLAQAIKKIESTPEEIFELNWNKLMSRKIRNKLHGDGDNR